MTQRFELITDHSALRWLKSLNVDDQKGRRYRWIEALQPFDFEVIHKAGRSKELSMADFLSRVDGNGDCSSKGMANTASAQDSKEVLGKALKERVKKVQS